MAKRKAIRKKIKAKRQKKKAIAAKNIKTTTANEKTTTAKIIIVLVILSFIASILFYPQMPEKMASHWGINGEVNGHMPKFLALFLMPFICIFMFLLFLFIPEIDPLKKNIEKFRKYFDAFIVLIIIFMLFLHALVILWNLGLKFSMNLLLAPAFGALFYYCGIMMAKAKRNWFIGIRTPWTLSSDEVWGKTHKLGGKLFKIAGIIALLGLFLPKFSFWLVIVPVLAFTLYIITYSYFEYKKIKKGKKKLAKSKKKNKFK